MWAQFIVKISIKVSNMILNSSMVDLSFVPYLDNNTSFIDRNLFTDIKYI